MINIKRSTFAESSTFFSWVFCKNASLTHKLFSLSIYTCATWAADVIRSLHRTNVGLTPSHNNNTWESVSCTGAWEERHWTGFPSGLQSAHWTTVTLSGWITQLSHSRSMEQNNRFYFILLFLFKQGRKNCGSFFLFSFEMMQCCSCACHEDLVSHGAALHAGSGVGVGIGITWLDCNWEVKELGKLKSQAGEISRQQIGLNFLATLTCSILDRVSHPAVDIPPLLPGCVDAGGVRLWLGLQVEGVQEDPPDGLQWPAVASAFQNASVIKQGWRLLMCHCGNQQGKIQQMLFAGCPPEIHKRLAQTDPSWTISSNQWSHLTYVKRLWHANNACNNAIQHQTCEILSFQYMTKFHWTRKRWIVFQL